MTNPMSLISNHNHENALLTCKPPIFERLRKMKAIKNEKPHVRIMKFLQSKLALAISGVAMGVLASGVTDDSLSTGQIFKKAGESYASLITYSDEGKIVTTVDGTTSTTAFLTRLARPNFYLVEWQQNGDSAHSAQDFIAQAVWFSGAGDFLDTGNGPQNEGNPTVALEMAAPSSGGASTTIPMTFFKIPSGNALDDSGFGERRRPDEKVGAVDCYVFSSESQGRTKTLWIGKDDFLIHQVRTVISSEAMQSALVQITKETPQTTAFLHGFTSTETHTNIVINKPLARSDFIPAIPHFATPYEDN
jgi:hypothetical protein